MKWIQPNQMCNICFQSVRGSSYLSWCVFGILIKKLKMFAVGLLNDVTSATATEFIIKIGHCIWLKCEDCKQKQI